MRAFVPVDSTARSLGADQVADALAGNGVELVRNGSRGLYWQGRARPSETMQ